MKMLFVDESEGFEKKRRAHFVLLGTIVDSEEMFLLESELSSFRKRFLGGKNLKHLRGYKTFEHEKKLMLTKKLCELIKGFDINFISAILGSRSCNDGKKSYINALGFLIERYLFYLAERDDRGIIILDTLATGHQSYIRDQLQKMISRERKREGKFGDRIFQIVFFGDDKHSNIIQLTDLLCAGLNAALQRYAESNSEAALNGNEDILVCYNSFLPLYWNFFRRFEGKVSGGGIKFWK